jgi:hypothetical protein
MRTPGRNEEKGTRLNRMAFVIGNEDSLPSAHEIHFVSLMGFLGIMPLRGI